MTPSEANQISFEPMADRAFLLHRLAMDHNPRSPIAVGERLAAMLNSMSSDEVAKLNFDDESALALLEQIEQALANLSARREMLNAAVARLTYWAKVTAPKPKKAGKKAQRRAK